MTFALIAVAIFLLVWIYHDAKKKNSVYANKEARRTNVELQKTIEKKWIEQIKKDIYEADTREKPVGLPKASCKNGLNEQWIRRDAFDFIVSLFDKYNLPKSLDNEFTEENAQKRIESDRKSYMLELECSKSDVGDYVYLSKHTLDYNSEKEYEIELYYGVTPGTFYEEEPAEYKYHRFVNSLITPKVDGSLYNAIVYNHITVGYYVRLIKFLTQRELRLEHNLALSDGVRESDWQELDKHIDNLKDYKEKYPWRRNG